MTVVPHRMPGIVESAGEIGVVASASTLGLPLVDGANHLLGHKMMSLIHHQGDPVGHTGTGRVYTYRHPDCDTLVARFYIESSAGWVIGVNTTVIFTAGSGVAASIQTNGPGYYSAVFDWDAADAGYQEITYVVPSYCDLRCISIWCAYRPTMDQATDLAIDRSNDTHALAGFDENKVLVYDDINNDIAGLAARVRDARRYTLRQAASWTGMGFCDSGSGAAWTNMLLGGGGPFTWRHQSRHIRSGDTTQDYIVFARTYFTGTGADTYDWRVVSNGGSATRSGLTRIAPGWDQASDNLEIDCTATDSLFFQMRYAAGTPTFYVCAISIFERMVS